MMKISQNIIFVFKNLLFFLLISVEDLKHVFTDQSYEQEWTKLIQLNEQNREQEKPSSTPTSQIFSH